MWDGNKALIIISNTSSQVEREPMWDGNALASIELTLAIIR